MKVFSTSILVAVLLLVICRVGSGNLSDTAYHSSVTVEMSGMMEDATEESETLELEDDDAIFGMKLDVDHSLRNYLASHASLFSDSQFLNEIIIPPPQG